MINSWSEFWSTQCMLVVLKGTTTILIYFAWHALISFFVTLCFVTSV